MRFDIVTLFPPMFDAMLCGGIVKRSQDSNLIQLQCWNPRDYTDDVHRTVDDRPYGGGPGMVMMVKPLRKAINAATLESQQILQQRPKVILLSPQGQPMNQKMLQEFATEPGLLMIAGRYEGIDERLIEHDIDMEVSLGDYVLSGGEIAAMALVDGVTRLLPGALGDSDSAEQDSFMQGILDCPHYTRPERVGEGDDEQTVPEILLSGDHKAIARWRLKQALGNTWLKRPDLLEQIQLDQIQQDLLNEFKHERGSNK